MEQLWRELGIPEPDHSSWGLNLSMLGELERIWNKVFGWNTVHRLEAGWGRGFFVCSQTDGATWYQFNGRREAISPQPGDHSALKPVKTATPVIWATRLERVLRTAGFETEVIVSDENRLVSCPEFPVTWEFVMD